jgi:acid stress-induced BolA-like protein IbaG/YrbA
MVQPEIVETKLKAAFPDAEIQISTRDGEHYDVTVVSESFAGKGRVQQHQMVYKTVQDEMLSGAIHAMSVKTFTPETWQANS